MFGLCWHQWGQWSDPYLVSTYSDKADAHQTRTCRKCKKVEHRVIGCAGDPMIKFAKEVVLND